MASDPEYPCAETRFGFRWGPVRVDRFWSDKRGVMLGILTDRGCVQVFVTPTGFVRVGKMDKRHDRNNGVSDGK